MPNEYQGFSLYYVHVFHEAKIYAFHVLVLAEDSKICDSFLHFHVQLLYSVIKCIILGRRRRPLTSSLLSSLLTPW